MKVPVRKSAAADQIPDFTSAKMSESPPEVLEMNLELATLYYRVSAIQDGGKLVFDDGGEKLWPVPSSEVSPKRNGS